MATKKAKLRALGYVIVMFLLLTGVITMAIQFHMGQLP